MPRVTPLVILMTIWLSTTLAQLEFISKITKGVNKEINTIVDPFQKAAVYIGFSGCTTVKRILGVNYDSYSGSNLDLNGLALNFRTRSVNMSYSLTSAAQLIPMSPWFQPDKHLKIYIHGFTDDPTRASYGKLSEAFLSHGDLNILALDASSLISSFYFRSTTMVQFIGEELGKLLVALVRARLLHPRNIHLIGHSLGSHISGFAGKTFHRLTGARVGRISGLDPAGPCFSNVNTSLRLNVNDAEFVDVIHTDAGVYGISDQIGHIDFYPNGGSNQPGCNALPFATCGHSRAWVLFAESVKNPQAFVAIHCASWNDFKKGNCNRSIASWMGYSCHPGKRGKFFLSTAEEAPYGLGAKGIYYVNNEGIIKSIANNITNILPG